MKNIQNQLKHWVITLFFLILLGNITYSGDNGNLKNFPFRIGAEFAGGISLESSHKLIVPGLIGFLDINLYDRSAFLKLEGGVFTSENIKYPNIYASVGLNFKIFNIKKNKFYLHGAFFVFGNKHDGGAASLYLSLRHLYPINKYVGVVSTIRYPFGWFDSFMLSAGIQFFTD